jgi:hypothetical protein
MASRLRNAPSAPGSCHSTGWQAQPHTQAHIALNDIAQQAVHVAQSCPELSQLATVLHTFDNMHAKKRSLEQSRQR